MIFISSINNRHPVTKTFTTLHPTTLHSSLVNTLFVLTPFRFPTAPYLECVSDISCDIHTHTHTHTRARAHARTSNSSTEKFMFVYDCSI